jgi:DNA-nicking Smr family endonuclease
MITQRHRLSKALSEEDRALWRAYAARVTPLPGRAPIDAPAPPAATAPGAVSASPAASPPPRAAPGGRGAAAPPQHPPPLTVNAAPSGLDARRWRDLRQGRTRPERTLDLHGRRAEEAHAATRAFLHRACAEGLRCVAIVTGKGAAAEGGGMLRRELPHWLNAPELRPLILGLAHPHAANAGAVHLLLRRRRAPAAALHADRAAAALRVAGAAAASAPSGRHGPAAAAATAARAAADGTAPRGSLRTRRQ